MRYLCLVYVDPTRFEGFTPEQDRALTQESMAYDKTLEASGNFITADALAEPRTAKTIKSRDGRIAVTDGPFPETKEHLGGFILIEAKDMDEAVEIGSKVPMARMGWIEVRPIMAMG